MRPTNERECEENVLRRPCASNENAWGVSKLVGNINVYQQLHEYYILTALCRRCVTRLCATHLAKILGEQTRQMNYDTDMVETQLNLN